MRIGSLFSGIGGLELGLEWAGVGHTVWQVEKDPHCQKVLGRHWPNATRYDDVCTAGAHNLEPVDVVCGGFPCQDISSAGKGAGIIAGNRSGLWYEFHRIVQELQPQWVVVENVAALASRKHRAGFNAVLGGLRSIGYRGERSYVSASDVGAPHFRERFFVVAYADSKPLAPLFAVGGTERSHPPASPWAMDAVDAIVRRYRPRGPTVAEPRHGESQVERESSGVGRFLELGAEGISPDRPHEAPSPLCGMDDGVPDRLDRLRALGNAVVPQVAEVVGRRLLQIHAEMTRGRAA